MNGRVHTLDDAGSVCEAVAFAGGRVLAVGSTRVVREAASGARVLDVEGRAVTPGLVDAHCHLLQYGLALLSVNLQGVRSLAELAERVRARAADLPAGAWVEGRGWDQERLRERRWPARDDLDAAVAGRPVLLRRVCGHAAVANTRALRAAGITATTPDPPDGRIERDVHGHPNGVLHEGAIRLVERRRPQPDADTWRRGLVRAVKRAHAAGLTGAHTMDVWEEGQLEPVRRLYGRLAREHGLPFGAYLLIGDRALRELRETGLRTGDGDDLVRVGPVKVFADGSLGARTAALRDPYADEPRTRGLLLHEPEALGRLVASARAAGCQVAIHAIGDRGADAAQDAFAGASAPGDDARHRLIHCQVMRPEQWPRMRRLGVIADIQPRFVASDLAWVERRLGRERARTAYAWRSITAAGVRACAGSDAPVEPVEPALGLHAAVTRTGDDGAPAGGWTPGERVDVETCLRWFTRGAAFASFAEGAAGALRPGGRADAVVWSQDPLTCAAPRLRDLRSWLTVVGGRVVHAA